MEKKISTLWFKYLTSKYLIYNTCWEDPSIDRFLLDLKPSSDIFMISSAGDNAFDYLLDNPSSIDSVDINPYQNALLDLKCALFKNGNHEHLKELFLTGKSIHYQTIFNTIENELDGFSSAFWNSRMYWFSPEKGFYHQGLTGWFARFLNSLIDLKGLRSAVDQLIQEDSNIRRTRLFNEKIEPILWKGFSKVLWKSDLVLGFAGIPSTQSSSIPDLNDYMKGTIRNLFVDRGVHSNYFWRLYLDGRYSEECCPNYLKAEYFESISKQLHKLSFSNETVTLFLNSVNKKYDHFILLDHQDWLIGNGTNELEKEWIALINSSKPKAKILFRSVHKDLHFLPDFVKERTSVIPIDQNYLRQNDRVGTYPSTFILEVDV